MTKTIALGGAKPAPPVHLIPATIKHSGAARVSTYFVARAAGPDPRVLEAAFRGRILKGCARDVPASYRGFVLADAEDGSGWRAEHEFSSFTYWNRETDPCSDDAVDRWLHWPAIANALHGVEEEPEDAPAVMTVAAAEAPAANPEDAHDKAPDTEQKAPSAPDSHN
eukprot:m51a1_g13756 hypothetical protein (167) ;mRNA; r:218435-219069